MKVKYLILKSNKCNSYWSYLGPEKSHKSSITSSIFRDRFLCTEVEEAVQFDTKAEALEYLNKLGMMTETFKIEEVYIVSP